MREKGMLREEIENIMKKKTVLAMMGLLLGLTACGTQETAEPSQETADSAQTEESTMEPQTQETEENTTSVDTTGFTEEMVLSTDLYTITVPDEFKGKFYAKTEGNEISFYDKETVDAGWPGFAFSVIVAGDEIMPGGMYIKLGELETSEGKFMNICKGYPSDVQWDYTKGEEAPESFKKLYDSADDIIKTGTGNNGSFYMMGAGTKGEDLYEMTLAQYVGAFTEEHDANWFEENGMSPEFYALVKSEGETALDKIGYAYKDVSADGVDELLVGIIGEGDEPSVVYDIYTMVDRQPARVVSGNSRDRYYALEYATIAREYSGGADEYGLDSYIIEPGSAKLEQQVSLKYDAYTDAKNPWFINYSEDESSWEACSEEDFNSRYEMYKSEFQKLDYTPISEIIPIDYSKVDLSKYGTFTQMLSDFKKGMGFANVKVGDTDVFLASSGTYNGENDTKNAIDASVFMYNDKGEICYLGTVQSSGTAYPIAVSDGCLVTGGHHFVTKTTVKDGKLVVAEEAVETFDTDANSTYTYTTEKDGEQKVEDDTNLTRLFDEYASAEIVEFSVEKP